jgi:hypothetical protein
MSEDPSESRDKIPGVVSPPAAGSVQLDHRHGLGFEFKFLNELKRRNVGRVAILYLVVCWLILEPVHVIFHMLDVPVWANRLVVMFMVLGFPAVTIFAWVYEVTPEGLKPTTEVPHGQSIRRQTARRIDRAIIAVLAVALVYFVADKFWLSNHAKTERAAVPVASGAGAVTPAATAVSGKSIAVLPLRGHERKEGSGVLL